MDCSGKAVREGEQNMDCRACLVALRASVSIACPAGRRENCGSRCNPLLSKLGASGLYLFDYFPFPLFFLFSFLLSAPLLGIISQKGLSLLLRQVPVILPVVLGIIN